MSEDKQLVVLETLYKLDENGMKIEDETTYEQWDQMGMTLVRLHNSEPFWIGDWINWGESRWGEKYTQAMALTKLEYGTVAHYKMVCSRIPIEQRVSGASFSHHRILLNHDPIQRARLLDRVVSDDLSVSALKASLSKGDEKESKGSVCSVCEKDIAGKAITWKVCLKCDANTKGEE